MDIDRLYGSDKFNIKTSVENLYEGARKILSYQIDPATFNQKEVRNDIYTSYFLEA